MSLRQSTPRILLATPLLLATSNVSADTFSGFHAGISTGLFTAIAVEDRDNTSNNIDHYGFETSLPSRFDLVAGWDYRHGNIYIGPEATWTFEHRTGGNHIVHEEFDEEFSLEESWSLGLRVGTRIDNRTLAFVKLSHVETEFAFSSVSDDEVWASGTGIGLGVEHALTDRFHLRFDVTRIDYNEADIFEGGWTVDAIETGANLGISVRF